MKTLRNIFFIVAACLVTSLAATAQSNDQLAQQLVEEMVKALNSQE